MLLFVYGTLKRGFNNHYLLRGARLIDTGIVGGRMLNLGGFPGLLLTNNPKEYVSGELYEITEDMLPALDRLEDHPNMYFRDTAKVYLDGNDRRDTETYAYVYWWNRRSKGIPIVETGEWTG